MFDHTTLIMILGITALGFPVLLLAVLGIPTLLNRPLAEDTTRRACQVTSVVGLLASVSVLALMLIHGTRYEAIELGEWVSIPGYHFAIELVFDRLSVPMAILSFVLCGTVAAFSTRYMHRERGYNRFFVLFALFFVGMVLTSLAGTIETLFAGWEMVGLSSALLVGFFHERAAPVRNGLRVWIVYRVSDAALLLAAILVHHLLRGFGDFDRLLLGAPWPEGQSAITGSSALLVGILFVIAAAGKSALVPFSGWLPRAMEGPTPSSAIFYGVLSVHLGAFLLLRVSPLLATSLALSILVVVLGLVTALYAHIVGSVQNDIKSALSFASLSQVGLVVAETGMGWHYIALVHLLGNACLRTLQFLRAPSLLNDYQQLENAIGGPLPRSSGPIGSLAPSGFRAWLYRFALERGYLDAMLSRFIVAPFVRLFEWCNRMERRWTDFLSGRSASKPEPVETYVDKKGGDPWSSGAQPRYSSRL